MRRNIGALLGILAPVVLVSGCKVKATISKITDAKMCTGMDEDGYPVGVATTFTKCFRAYGTRKETSVATRI